MYSSQKFEGYTTKFIIDFNVNGKKYITNIYSDCCDYDKLIDYVYDNKNDDIKSFSVLLIISKKDDEEMVVNFKKLFNE